MLITLGVSADRLQWEGISRNTTENAMYTKQLYYPAETEVWLVVTSSFQMHRTLNSFEAAGWHDIIPFPVDFRTGESLKGASVWTFGANLTLLNIAFKEWAGIVAYNLFSR